jgi:hypothetical protein
MRTDNHTNTDRATDRQHVWTPAENALIAELAPGKPTARQLRELFPDRTLGAIRQKLHFLRRQLGEELRRPRTVSQFTRDEKIATTMLDRDDPGLPDNWQSRWSHKAADSNGQFLAALQRLAA